MDYKIADIPADKLLINNKSASTTGRRTRDELINDYMLRNKTTCVLPGDTISANGQSSVVARIEYLGHMYGLVVHCDNGQTINSAQLKQLVNSGVAIIS